MRNTDAASVPIWATFVWMFGSASILLAAVLLTVGKQRDVIVPWANIVVPETCSMHTHIGIDCPGCGLTRCFIHIAHGNFASAFVLSPVGIAVFAYVAFQIPLSLIWLFKGREKRVQRLVRINQNAMLFLVFALLAQWLYRLVFGGLY